MVLEVFKTSNYLILMAQLQTSKTTLAFDLQKKIHTKKKPKQKTTNL